MVITYLTHPKRMDSPEDCKIVAGGRRPPEHDPIDSQHPERVRDVTVPPIPEVAPLQGANPLTVIRRSSLRFDLRLLSDNPTGWNTPASLPLLWGNIIRLKSALYVIALTTGANFGASETLRWAGSSLGLANQSVKRTLWPPGTRC